MELKRTCLLNKRTHFTSSIHIAALLLLGANQCFTANLNGIRPMILSNEADITVLPNENVKITCQSTQPIRWRFHTDFSGEYKVRNSYSHINKHIFESTLELPRVDYMYVGYYHCVKNSSIFDANLETLVRNNEASSIYLFIEDPDHPLAFVNVPIVQGNRYEDVVIPCKPTSKNVEVQLIKDGDERHQFESAFIPTDGFRITLNGVTDGGFFTCHTKSDTAGKFDIPFVLHVESEHKFANRPRIASKTDNFGIEGTQLELNCSIEVKFGTGLDIKWMLPNSNISFHEGRAHITELIAENHERFGFYYAVSKLVIDQLDKTKDAGEYRCFVDDQPDNSAALEVVQILGANESFINITEPSGNYNLIVTSHQNEATLLVWYSGYPTPTLVWYDNHGAEIPWTKTKDTNRSHKFEASQDKRSTTLKIKNLQINDSGYYILYANNGRMQKEQKFQLLVKGRNKEAEALFMAQVSNHGQSSRSSERSSDFSRFKLFLVIGLMLLYV